MHSECSPQHCYKATTVQSRSQSPCNEEETTTGIKFGELCWGSLRDSVIPNQAETQTGTDLIDNLT